MPAASGPSFGLGLWREEASQTGQPRLSWSRPLYDIFGEKPDTFTLNPDTWLSLVHPDDRDAALKARRAGREHGIPYDISYRAVLRDGTSRTIREQAEPVRSPDGSVSSLFGLCQISDTRTGGDVYRNLIEYSLDGVLLLDTQARVTISNPAARAMLGYSETELAGKSMRDTYKPQERALFDKRFAAIQTAKQLRLERGLLRKDGSFIPVEILVSLMPDSGFILFMRDVSERVRLQQASERLVSIVESTPDFIGTATPDMKVIYMNDAFKRILPEKYRTDGAIPADLSITAFHPPEISALLRDTAIPYAVRHGVWQGEAKLLDATGKEFPILQTIIAHLDMDGKLDYLSTIARDVSGLMKSQETLRASEAEYRSLFTNMLDGFALCEMEFENGKPANFTYLAVNDAFGVLTGLKDVVGKQVTEVIPGIKKDNPEIFDLYGRVVLTGAQERFEAFSPAFGGWLSVRAYRPEKGHFAAIFENITERKVAEQRVMRLNRVYAFLSQINQTIVHVKEREELFRDICRIAISHGKFAMAWIGLMQPNGLVLPVASDGRVDGFLTTIAAHPEMPSGTDGYTVVNNIAGDARAQAWRDRALERGYRSVITLSIQPGVTPIGTFNLYAGEANAFSEDEIALLKEVTRDVGYALENIDRNIQLAHQQAFANALIDNSLDIITVLDANGVITYDSPAVETILGYSKGALLGKNVFSYVHPEDVVTVKQALAQVLTAKRSKELVTYRFKHADGSWKFIRSLGNNLLNNPEIRGILVNSRDVTQLLEAEAVKVHSEELERTNKVMVDRELKMIELKTEIADLKKQIALRRS